MVIAGVSGRNDGQIDSEAANWLDVDVYCVG